MEHVDQIRDLGIIIDSKLTFAQHVDHAVKRANRALGLLMRSFQTGARPGKFRTVCLRIIAISARRQYRSTRSGLSGTGGGRGWVTPGRVSSGEA